MYQDYLRTLLRLQIAIQEIPEEKSPLDGNVSYSSPEEALTASSTVRTQGTQVSAEQGSTGAPGKPAQEKTKTYAKDKDDPYVNVGRNDPCPCGSGKKYKKCHGANE